MKTAHIADLHECPERHKKVMRILDAVEEIAPEVDLISNSGENFNNPYNFTEQSGFNEFLDKWGSITNEKPVVTVRGTQGKHERPGMVETLERVGVKLLQPGKQYSLLEGRVIEGVLPLSSLQMFGVPHAHKSHIMAGDEKLSRDEANAKVNQQMRELYTYYGAMRAEYPEIPALAVGHGVIQGKNTRDLEAIKNSSIYSTESDLALMGCGFYAWGHYHVPTEFELINGGYLGSFAWDFKECDYKPAITIVDWDTMTAERRELDINMRKVVSMFPGDKIPDLTGCDVWLKNNQTEWTESDCKDAGAGYVKVTTEVEIENKIRSQAVVEAVSYPDKFKAVYPDATGRQLQVCDEFWEADKAEGKIPYKKVITPLWVEIYGSKTFMERLGKDKIRFDLRDYSDLVMLIGPGGHGKSSLFDYISPFSVLFLQANSLISTFELEDSYVKQAYVVNGVEYQIEKLFKPTIKKPTAEYHAYEVKDGKRSDISGLTGNRQPYDEWCVQMFGTPRKYATSVLNTQFDDNTSKFMGQPINPSIFQATNIELKALFHELAGTDLKHLELKCKAKADEFKNLSEAEEIKKQGAAENIPSQVVIHETISTLNEQVGGKEYYIKQENDKAAKLTEDVKLITKQEEKNREIDAVNKNLKEQVEQEEGKKRTLENDLSSIGNIDIESLNRQLIELESEKTRYEARLAELPAIQERNSVLRNEYSSKLEDYNKDLKYANDYNSEIDRILAEIESAKRLKDTLESSKHQKIANTERETTRLRSEAVEIFNRESKTLNTDIATLTNRISEGQGYIDSIKACPQCGYVDPEAEARKTKYTNALKELESQRELKQKAIGELSIKQIDPVIADTSEEDRKIAECEQKINQNIVPKKETPVMPIDPEYENESIPSFDMSNYNNLKEKVSAYSEDKITELRTKITESQKRIGELEEKIRANVKETIDYTAADNLKAVESNIKMIETAIEDLKRKIAIEESKLDSIQVQLQALEDYDKRIEEYNKEFNFWNDMKQKWGPKGIPARILEHTGPYVEQLANSVLKKYYPVYKVHTETTRNNGKKELEIFSINVINQETGREKPINCISGEERNFVNEALRHAFRTVNLQNSLEEWTVNFEDEPDAHVSSDSIQNFWDMVEEITAGKTAFCIAHSQEVKYRSATSIDIRNV